MAFGRGEHHTQKDIPLFHGSVSAEAGRAICRMRHRGLDLSQRKQTQSPGRLLILPWPPGRRPCSSAPGVYNDFRELVLDDNVVSRSPVEQVGAGPSLQHIVIFATKENIVTGAADEDIVTGSALH